MYSPHSLRTKKIEKDKQFVSGMRFIYNIINHQAKQYNITDLIVPDFNIESNCYLINNNGDILVPLGELDFRLEQNGCLQIRHYLKKQDLVSYATITNYSRIEML